MNSKITGAIVVAVAALLLAAVALSGLNLNVGSQAAPSTGLVETIEANGNFTRLVGALNSTGLSADLNGSGPFTVFAPTDAAFDALNQSGNGTANGMNLTGVLSFHVVSGELTPSKLTNSTTLTTLEGSKLVVFNNATGTYVNGAKIDLTRINATNGVAYSIDKVLIPQTVPQILDNETEMSQLNDAISAANLTKTLNGTGPFTVFAPNDAAFSSLNESMKAMLASNNTTDQAKVMKLLQYHVVPTLVVIGNETQDQTLVTASKEKVVVKVDGDNVTVNGVKVTQTVVGTNGVVYVVDKVLIQPMSILDTAKANGLTRWAAAVEQANLTKALNATGPFTVFAPNDAAFEAMGEMSLDQENLTKVLLYHVVPGELFTWEMKNGSLTTLNGQKVNITVIGGDGNVTGNATSNATGNVTVTKTVYMVNNATIVIADILCSNGVIQVIDQVLIPPNMNSNTSTTPEPTPGPTPTPTPEPTPEQPQTPTTPSC
jgi:transforming growth factor-beta-induced protein